jgi:hypothetical protein
LVFVIFIHLTYINTWSVFGKNLGPKKKHFLCVLEFFFLRNKVLDIFPRLGKNLKTCSNLACYAYNTTLVMYLSMKKIQLSIWMCH